MANTYRTPDNKYTDADTAMKAWEKLYKPLCEEYGLRIVGFDPDLLFEDTERGLTLQIPTWFAKRLVAKI